jgi:Protein of unknown function (DUF3301)
MNADLAYFLVAACTLAAIYGFWHTSLGAREAANRIAREACSRAVVQLLDGTVAFAGFSLGREAGRRFTLLRTYTFDYTSNGIERSQGFIVMSGANLKAVGLAGASS